MRARLQIGYADVQEVLTTMGLSATWVFEVTEEGLTLDWGDPVFRLFFAWDEYNSEPDPAEAQTAVEFRRKLELRKELPNKDWIEQQMRDSLRRAQEEDDETP